MDGKDTDAKDSKSDSERIGDLKRYEILDTEKEFFYDTIVKLAAATVDAPIAAISLLDADRQWFKASTGLAVKETARDISFCTHTIEGQGAFIVQDALLDPRFVSNPLVTGPSNIRFYAGFPLVNFNGNALGALCVIDNVPRTLTPGQIENLNALTDLLMAHLEDRGRLMMSERSIRLSELGEMLAGIAHEISNPLAIIQGNIGLLKTALQTKAGDARLMLIADRFEATTARINKIIKNLKNFSRQGDPDAFVSSSVKTTIEDAIELCRARMKSGQVKHEVVLPSDELMLTCNSVQVAQVLVCLFNNAVDAVSVSSEKWIKVVVTDTESEVSISVSDSGPGVPEKIRNEIMLPFFTTKPPGQGTGLGLSLAKKIALAHGGSLTLSPDAASTTFIFTLPKRERFKHGA